MWCIVSSSTCSSVAQPDQPPADQRPAAPGRTARCASARTSTLDAPPPRSARRSGRARPARKPGSAGADPLHRLAVHRRERRAQRLVPRHDRRPAPARSAARSSRPSAAAASGMWYASLHALQLRPGTTAAAAQTTAAAAPSRATRLDRRQLLRRAGPAPTARASSASARMLEQRRAAAAPRPSACRTREITCIASSECPPSSKKLSCRPTRSTPSSSAQIPASSVSASPCGRLVRSAGHTRRPSGAGSALRSSLPFGVSGSASSHTYAAGTMYSGSSPDRCARSSSPAPAALPAAPPRTPPAASRPARPRAPPPPPRAPPGCSAQPRLDLAQLDAEPAHLHLVVDPAQELERPRPARHRTRSPVRYSRAPVRPLNGSGTNRSAVSSGRFR